MEVKSRGELFMRQKEEIGRLTQMTQKEEKEIERLKMMLRMNEKKNQSVQTEEQVEDSSWRKRIEVSTGESEMTSETRCERSSLCRQSQSRDKLDSRRNAFIAVAGKPKLAESRLTKANGKERAPLTKKYKFIPTLSFKHI